MGGFIERFASRFAVCAVQFDFEILADMNGLHAAVAHMVKGVLDGFALRVEHGLFRSNDDLCFHECGFFSPPEIRRYVGQQWAVAPDFSDASALFCASNPRYGT